MSPKFKKPFFLLPDKGVDAHSCKFRTVNVCVRDYVFVTSVSRIRGEQLSHYFKIVFRACCLPVMQRKEMVEKKDLPTDFKF